MYFWSWVYHGNLLNKIGENHKISKLNRILSLKATKTYKMEVRLEYNIPKYMNFNLNNLKK